MEDWQTLQLTIVKKALDSGDAAQLSAAIRLTESELQKIILLVPPEAKKDERERR